MSLYVISTLGPSSSDDFVIKKLLNISNKFRLNASHLTKSELKSWLDNLSKIFKETNKTIPVVIDLQGAKIRIAEYPPTELNLKDITIKYCEKSDDLSVIPLLSKDFFNSVKENDIISLNDAKIKLKILSNENFEIKCTVLQHGFLASNKGINCDNHPVVYNEITQKDLSAINIGNDYDFTEFAFSFVYDGKETDILKKFTTKKLIAKAEREEAINNIYEIDKKFDEIWFCRGDLGANCGLKRLGELQYKYYNIIPQLNNDSVLAGQVLEHLTQNELPTRSEIAHLYDIEQKGFKGIVLSDETAIGTNPLKVAEFLTYWLK